MKRDAVGNTADWQNTKMRLRERVPTDSELLKDLSKNESYKTTKPFTVGWTNSGKNFRIDVIHSSLSSHSACSVSFPHYLCQAWTRRREGEEMVGGDCLVVDSGKWTSRDSSTEDEPKRMVWPILPRKFTKTHTRLRWMAYCLPFVGL